MKSLWRISCGVIVSSCCLFGTNTARAFAPPQHGQLPNLDLRARDAGTKAAATNRNATVAQLTAAVPDVRVDFDEVIGSPKWVLSRGGFLSGPSAQGRAISPATARLFSSDDPYRATKGFLQEHNKLFGHGAEVLAEARITREFVTPHNGMKTVVWEQQLDGIIVFEGLLISHTTKKDELVSISSRFVPNAAAAAAAGTPNRNALQKAPNITAQQAVSIAAQNLGEELASSEVHSSNAQITSADLRQELQATPFNGNIEAHLVWLPMSDSEMKLCWEIILVSRARGEGFRVLVDAQTGEVTIRHCLTEYASDATYRVYTSDSPSPFSPGNPTPVSTQPSFVSRSLLTFTAVNTNASPNGWIDDGVNETRGNNVDAHTDRDNNDSPDLPRPQGSPFRTFDFSLDLTLAPSAYTNAAVTQLFYWNNWMHDKLYALGFTEAAGNFQVNNFGRGGLGNDAVQADAQDGGGTDNANFYTPPDGSTPRMQMYVFTGPTPDRDGDLDAEIVLHEYTHGLSNRRVGGGVGISALQSEGMGEGWSDWYAISLLSEPGDDVNGVYAAGAYATYQLSGLTQNYYYGIRRYPYCTDMTKNPLTFRDIDPAQASTHTGIPRSPIIGTTANEVHNMGEVWCVTLWEARANLINKYGDAVGNQLILQLVTDGMNLSPANPNFLQSRDAILQADVVDNGGANYAELWMAFAKRGMGISASSPSSSTTVGLVEAYDLPDSLSIVPATLMANGPVGGPFSPNPATFTLNNTGSSNLNWSLSSTSTWITVSPSSGTLVAGGPSASVNVTVQPAANLFPLGTYNATIRFTNQSSGIVQTRTFSLNVIGRSMSDDFEPNIDLSQWSAFGGTVGSTILATNYGGSISAPNSLWFGDAGSRFATTIPINTSGGGTFGFSIRLANGASAPWEEADALPDEGVTMESSTNGGVAWQVIGNYDTTAYYNWTTVTSAIPISARSPATLFRWRQKSHSGFGFDHWALDNVSIDAVPAQSLALNIPANATEGNAPLTGTVSASPVPTTNLVVTLNSSDTTEVIVPPTVTILAGQSNANFSVTIVDDALLDGPQSATVTATAPPYQSANGTITVADNETATLTVSLPASVTEGDGTLPVGTVTASAAPAANITVNLSSSDTTEITVPNSVILPAGQTSVGFNITVVNDTQIDGDQTATITAHVANWTDGFTNVVVHDNEPTNLVVTLPAMAREGDGVLLNAGTVRISGTLSNNLIVALQSSDTTELTVPLSATIVSGQTFATFNLTIIDDPDVDSSQNVSVTATAGGFSPGVTNMTVTDNESPPVPFNPSPAHLATNVIQSSDLAWQSGAVPGEIITNDVYFGTNPTPGPSEFLGTTTNTIWALPNLYPQTTYYWQIVARKTGVTPGPVWRFTTRGLDHFTWNSVPSPQFVNQPFSVTVSAKDAFETTVSNFTGTVGLSGRTGTGGASAQTILFFEDVNRHFFQIGLDQLGLSYQAYSNATQSAFTTAVALADPNTTLVIVDDAANFFNSPSTIVNFIAAGGRVIFEYWDLDTQPALAAAFNASVALEMLTPQPVYDWGGSAIFSGLPNPVSFVETNWADDGDQLNATAGGVAVGGFTSSPIPGRAATVIGNSGRTILNGFLLDDAQFSTDAIQLARNEITMLIGSGGSIAISPTNSGSFVNGSWTGNISVLQPTTNMFLRASDSSGHSGDSNPFAVELRNDIGVTLTDSPDPVSLGGNVTYAISVTNIGPLSATSVIVTNRLPATVSLVSVTTSQGTITTNGTALLFSLGTLSANASASISIVARANSVGVLTNQTTLSRAEADAYAANNSATATTAVQTPLISIKNVSLFEGNSGTANAIFNVTISPAPAAPVSVNFATANVSAISPGDYFATNGVLNFALGETNKNINVIIKGDTLYEFDETFVVNLSGAVNATIANSQATGTILNDDAIPMISIGDVTLTEGNNGTTNAVFPVSLSAASSLDVSVNFYTGDGSAYYGSDYNYTSGTLVIPAGRTTTNIVVQINGDLQIEPDEVFYVDLSSAANAILLKREAYGLILNDDGLPGNADHFVWSTIPSPQYVGQPFDATITALDAFNNPANNFSGPAQLSVVSGSTTTVGTDTSTTAYPMYTSYDDERTQVIYPASELGGAGRISGLALYLENIPGLTLSNWTIRIKHTPLTSYSSYLWETNGWTVVFQTNLNATVTGWVTFPFTTPFDFDGTNSLMIDFSFNNSTYYGSGYCRSTYRGVTRTLYYQAYSSWGYGDPLNWSGTFPSLYGNTYVPNLQLMRAGEVVTIQPLATGSFTNGVWAGPLTAQGPATNLVLRADDGAGHFGTSGAFAVMFRDDIAISVSDAPDPVAVGANVTYSISVTNSGPGAANNVMMTNILSPGMTLVSVNPSQGTYVTVGQNVLCDLGTIAGGNKATIAIVATPGAAGIVTNFASVSRSEADSYLGNNSATNTTVVVTPALSISDTTVMEPNGGTTNAIFNVTLSIASPQTITVNYATANGTASAGTDYSATNGVLNFAPGQTNGTIIVSVLDDAVTEQNETFFVNLSGAVNAAISKGSGIGIILDNEGPPDFQITGLFTNNSKVVDHDSITGDDRGGVAISPTQVFVTGDAATARFNATDLTGGVSIGRIADSLCTDLRTETVYALGNGSTPLTSSGGTVTTLIEINGATGAPTGVVLPLSQSFTMSSSGNGIFSGYGRIVVHNGTTVYDIFLPAGTVTVRGAMTRPNWYTSESWSIWGVAEFFNGALYLTYRDASTLNIVRSRVPDGQVSTVGTFLNLSDMASFVVSPSRNRWYFHYEGSGQFGGLYETLGYADAQFSFVNTNPPSITAQPANQVVRVGGTAVFAVTANGAIPLNYQWRKGISPLQNQTNATLILSNIQSNDAGIYNVVVTNLYGIATSSNASLFITTNTQVIVGILGSGDVSERDALATTLTNFGFNVQFISQGQWSNVDVVVAYPSVGSFGPSLAEISSGVAFIQISDHGSDWTLNNWASVVEGASVTINVDTAHPITAGLPASWTTYGFWRYGYTAEDYVGWSTDTSLPSLASTTIPTAQSRVLVATSIGSGKAVYLGWNVYGPDAGPNDLAVFRNALVWAANAVPSAPAITSQPVNQTVVLSNSAAFTVTASGTSPLRYQWRRDDVSILGATNSGYATGPAPYEAAGSYSVVVSNNYGYAISSNATLIVMPFGTNLTINALDTGWYDSTGFHGPSNPNYIVGESSSTYRDWFAFTVPTLPAPITSAQLRLFTYGIVSPDGSETLQLRHVSTPVTTLRAGGSGLVTIYNDLGDGTIYGSRTFATSESSQFISMTLNSDCVTNIAAASGQSFAIGGELTTFDSTPGNSEYIFGSSLGNPGDVQLILTFVTNQPPLLSSINWQTDGTLQIILKNAGGSPITPGRASKIQLYASTNLSLTVSNWTDMTSALVLTNGVLRLDSLSTSNAPQQYFRPIVLP
jgi:uncharacterized repeat protein (TIGR01451 family)